MRNGRPAKIDFGSLKARHDIHSVLEEILQKRGKREREEMGEIKKNGLNLSINDIRYM